MQNVLEMTHRFQADLSGWLEQESKQPTLHSKIFQLQMLSIGDHDSLPTTLLESLALTLDYYGNSTEAFETLHNTVFQAVLKNKDYRTDFDALNFKVGIDHRLLHHISERFDLHKYTCLELWKIPTTDALEFIYITFRQTMKPLRYFHKMVIKLLQRDDRPMDDQSWRFEWWLSFQFQIDSEARCVMDHFEYLLEVFYDCMFENQSRAKKNPSLFWKMKSSTKRLFSVLRDVLITLFERCTLYYKRGLTIESVMLLRMIFNIAEKDATSLPASLKGFIDDVLFRETNVVFPVKTCQDTRKEKHSLQDDWNQMLQTDDSGGLTFHEKTFMVICSHLQDRSLASIELGQLECTRLGFDRLVELIQTKISQQKSGHVNYLKCKLWCCYAIRNRASYWLSVLKVVIQFADLWINDMLESQSADVFAALIVQEGMMSVLYTLIVKHVQRYYLNKAAADFIKIKNLCLLLEKSFECVTSVQELLAFRELVFKERDPNEDIRLPIFKSTTLWNIPFEPELIKACNQITSTDESEDNEVPEEVVQKLILLSIIWPYKVLCVLVQSSFQNRNQYKAIVPLIKQLGNLNASGKTSTCSHSLLLLAFKDTVHSMNTDAYQDNIVHFIKACCHLEFHQEYPLILSPNSITESYPVLLNLKDVLSEFILQNFRSFSLLYDNVLPDEVPKTAEFSETRLLRLSLYILNAFCEFPTSNTNKVDANTINVAYSNRSDLPALLYVFPEEFVRHLTNILASRNRSDKRLGLRLQDWEMAINYLEVFKAILQYGLIVQPEIFTSVFEFFSTQLNEYDWKSRLLWYRFTRRMAQQPVSIPYGFFRITGELGGLLVGHDKQDEFPGLAGDKNQLDGWCDLIDACKLSETMRNMLFEHAYQWQYNLILLWKHPYEDEIIQNCFRRVLHPSSSFSVSIEYGKLLRCFLGQLYDTFACHQVIRDYEKYEAQDQIIPIIHRLSEQGTKLYYTVLYTMQLLEHRSDCSNEQKYDNYYVTSLIKVLQNLTDWSNINKTGQIRSYNELRKFLRESGVPKPEPHSSEQALPKGSLLTSPSFSAETAMLVKTEPEIIYYPLLNTAESISDRALSILTLYHLCSLHVQFKNRDETQRDAITRLILQVAEGLIDTDSRLLFQKMLQQQPKSRIMNWKKKSKISGRKIMKMRPIITQEEHDLLRPKIICMHNAGEILQALGLIQPYNSNNNNQALYFI